MPGTNNDRGTIEDRVIGFHLAHEANQRIPITFYFIARQAPIDHGDIGAALPVSQSKLVEDERVRAGVIVTQHLPMKVFPYNRVIHSSDSN